MTQMPWSDTVHQEVLIPSVNGRLRFETTGLELWLTVCFLNWALNYRNPSPVTYYPTEQVSNSVLCFLFPFSPISPLFLDYWSPPGSGPPPTKVNMFFFCFFQKVEKMEIRPISNIYSPTFHKSRNVPLICLRLSNLFIWYQAISVKIGFAVGLWGLPRTAASA